MTSQLPLRIAPAPIAVAARRANAGLRAALGATAAFAGLGLVAAAVATATAWPALCPLLFLVGAAAGYGGMAFAWVACLDALTAG